VVLPQVVRGRAPHGHAHLDAYDAVHGIVREHDVFEDDGEAPDAAA
jgi:hypothetical protein